MYFPCIKTESSMLQFADNRSVNTKTQQRTTITTQNYNNKYQRTTDTIYKGSSSE